MEFEHDDDLINDYIEDVEDEPPPEYDEDFLEDLIDDVDGGAVQRSGHGQAMEMGPSPTNADQDDPLTVTANVHEIRESFASRNQSLQDPYRFERYQHDASWRSREKLSVNDMKAENWIPREEASNRSLGIGKRMLAAPEAQLLEYSELVGKSRSVYVSPKRMPIRPKEGCRCIPMTLGDGTRVLLPVQHGHLSTENMAQQSMSRNCGLGVSMNVLLERVNNIRRRREFENMERLSAKHLELEDLSRQVDRDLPKCKDSRLWVDKHAPSTFAHLLSDERTNREVIRALRAWDPYVFNREPPKRRDILNNGKKPDGSPIKDRKGKTNERERRSKDRRPDEFGRVLLLSGPPGVGKTTLAHIAARHVGYQVVEVNGSDERSASALTERVIRAMESTTLNMIKGGDPNSSGKPNCLVLDEVDGADAKGAMDALVEIVRAPIPQKGAKGKNRVYLRRPIILICNNKYSPALRSILPYARHFDVASPPTGRLVARLRSILSEENLSVAGGSTLLNQLVIAAGGDIRSCLYSLQFATYRAREVAMGLRDASIFGRSNCESIDITEALISAMNGDGLKDSRNDVTGTIKTIFQKKKVKTTLHKKNAESSKGQASSVDQVLQAVYNFGDDFRILDTMFMNILRIPYIDPTLDRCAAIHEWLSKSDVSRTSSDDSTQILAAAGAIHLFCRIEQIADLTFSNRDIFDAKFKHDANQGLIQRFAEGMTLGVKHTRASTLVATETIPYALWILSAGTGSHGLHRSVTSMELLNKVEQVSVEMHANVMRSLGLVYAELDEKKKFGNHFNADVDMKLNPPIDQIVRYDALAFASFRREIPAQMKKLVMQKVLHDKINLRGGFPSSSTEIPESIETDVVAPSTSIETQQQPSKRPKPEIVEDDSPSKRLKVSLTAVNFLSIGAMKAKEARSLRTAARVGVVRKTKAQTTHTGSGMPLSQVLRLKYVKGFTQAVRTPCRIDDLA